MIYHTSYLLNKILNQILHWSIHIFIIIFIRSSLISNFPIFNRRLRTKLVKDFNRQLSKSPLSLSLSCRFLFETTKTRVQEEGEEEEEEEREWCWRGTPTGLERQWNNVTEHVSETDRSQMGNKSHAMPRRSAPRGTPVSPFGRGRAIQETKKKTLRVVTIIEWDNWGGREGHSKEALFRNYITLAKYNIYNFYIYIIIIYIIYNFWDYKSNLILGDLGEDYIFIIYNLFYRMKFLYML